MRKSIFTLGIMFIFSLPLANLSQAQDMQNGFKTTIDMRIDSKGSTVCEYGTKYNAAYWDNFLRTVGSNTSILKNMIIRMFPKYVLSDFTYTQDPNSRSNKVTFKIDGMMTINKNGKWMADLEQKDPDITKISDAEFLLLQEGTTLKIHLPEGTSGAKIEKDSFGKAMLTYPANEGGLLGKILLFAGIAIMALGGFLLYRNMKGSTQRSNIKYETVTARKVVPAPELATLNQASNQNPVLPHNTVSQNGTAPYSGSSQEQE